MTNTAESALRPRVDLTLDLLLPTLLMMAFGGMTWAVRGCSGYGTVAGCTFAGMMWGVGWWYLGKTSPTRPYASGWLVLAVVLGVGLAGDAGWMQWPEFFLGKMLTNAGKGESVPISRTYGFVWMFLAGMPWAGIGACLLAFTGGRKPSTARTWALRIACGAAGYIAFTLLNNLHPELVLPLYREHQAKYADLVANPNLRRVTIDTRETLQHLGIYLGFLAFELGRLELRNVVLIATVGILNGLGWALCQAWKWAPGLWPTGRFNYWRCWESSGGLSIGLAYGVAFFLANRRIAAKPSDPETQPGALDVASGDRLLVFAALANLTSMFLGEWLGGWGETYFAVAIAGAVIADLFQTRAATSAQADSSPPRGSGRIWGAGVGAAMIAGLFLPETGPTLLKFGYLVAASGIAYALRPAFRQGVELAVPAATLDREWERFGLGLGLLIGLGISIRAGVKGWCNIYLGNERYWSDQLWKWLGPVFLLLLVLLFVRLARAGARDRSAVGRYAYGVLWLVILVQNTLAQLITGPPTEWTEVAFNIYYVLLFLTSAVIVVLYRRLSLVASHQ